MAGPTPSRVTTLSARAAVSTANPLIAGFVVAGPSAKRLLLRAIGPTLSSFGVTGAHPDPVLTVYGPDSSVRIAAANDNWGPAGGRPGPLHAELNQDFQRAGAFPLPISLDAAFFADFAPGAYTVEVGGTGAASGVALVEVYDADSAGSGSRLANVSVRATVGTGDNLLIPGLTVGPGTQKTVLLRAVGPGLAAFGVPDPLPAPVLALFSGSQLLARNVRWTSAPDAAQLALAASRVGAFPLAPADSALLATLGPGSYTLQLSGAAPTTGPALVEIYEVP